MAITQFGESQIRFNLAVAPLRIDAITSGYSGSAQIVMFIPIWTTTDPMTTKAVEEIQWQKSVNGGTFTDLDGVAGLWTTEAQPVVSLTSGTVALRCRAKAAGGDVSATVTSATVTYSAIRPVAVTFFRPGTLSTGLGGTSFTCPPGINMTLIGIRLGLILTGTTDTTVALVKSAGTGVPGQTGGFVTSATGQPVSVVANTKAINTDTITTSILLAPNDQIDLNITSEGTGAAGLSAEYLFTY